jgi:anti-anti-sigma regulatory factor
MIKLTGSDQSMRIEGRLDIGTIKEAHEALHELGWKPKHLDAGGLEGLDSAGVQWLWWVARHHDGALQVTHASKPVQSVLKAAGFERWVTP